MPTYRAQVVIPFFTNMPSDVITNTWHFDPLTPLDFEEVRDLVTPRLVTLYGTVYGGGRGLADYVVDTAGTVRWYDLQAPPPRAPVILPFALPATSSTSSIPTEVALVLSFQAPQVSGAPQARRRGRVYFGALTSSFVQPATSSSFPRFTDAAVSSIAAAAAAFMDGLESDGVRWTVWSPTDQASAIVTNGWVDNSPDTQRRRSVDATSRTTWS